MIHSQLKENGVGEMLLKDLAMLREEMIRLLARIAEHHKSTKEKCVFFINNYDQILSLFKDRHLVSDDTAKFEKMVNLLSFSPFKSAAHALENANDISEGAFECLYISGKLTR